MVKHPHSGHKGKDHWLIEHWHSMLFIHFYVLSTQTDTNDRMFEFANIKSKMKTTKINMENKTGVKNEE